MFVSTLFTGSRRSSHIRFKYRLSGFVSLCLSFHKMEESLNNVVSEEELKKFERIYFDLLAKQTPSIKAQFEYAWCLVRSKYPADIKKGIVLLEDLCKNDVAGRRDYLYYLSIGHVRIKEYSKALEYCRAFLETEPTNKQVQELEGIVKKRMNKEGKIGIAITMAGVVLLGGIISLGMSLAKSK